MNALHLPSILLIAASLLLTACATPKQSQHVNEADYRETIRVACVGDSITYGHLLPNREQNSYPAKLSALLGKKWEVRNFGVNGATALKKGSRPYWTQQAFKDALSFRPDVVILQLGTNDTAPVNWQTHEAEFASDYADLLNRFTSLDTKPRVFVCRPVPIFRDRGKVWDTGLILQGGILPRIDEAAHKAHLPVIDLHATFTTKSSLFPDGVHPNAEGVNLMAQTIYTAVTGHNPNP